MSAKRRKFIGSLSSGAAAVALSGVAAEATAGPPAIQMTPEVINAFNALSPLMQAGVIGVIWPLATNQRSHDALFTPSQLDAHRRFKAQYPDILG